MTTAPTHDRGGTLPLTLVMSVTLMTLVISLLSLTASNLKYGTVIEERADRLSAAEAGLRHVLDKVQVNGLLCSTNAGNGPGIDIDIPDEISGVAVSVNCAKTDWELSDIASWGVVVTGEGIPAGEHGFVTNSGNGDTKIFGGPSFIADPSLMDISAPLELRDGDLWYTDPTCPDGGAFQSDGSEASWGDLSFSPTSRGVWCTAKTWDELFSEPSIPTLPTVVDPAPTTIGTCTVFEPARYTVEPAWGPNTYLMSGDYVFDDVGEMAIGGVTITAGRQGVGADQQVIDNSACDVVRDNLDSPLGATLYLDGDSRFTIQADGSLEILRRQHDSHFVSIHTLPTHTLDYQQPVLASDPGAGKQLAVHGLVWAPRTAVEFGEVTNTAIAQLSGGVVVARIEADPAALISGFVVQVLGSPQSGHFQFTARAENTGITEVSVVVEMRFSSPPTGVGVGTWELAMNSWRVCDGLC